MTVKEFIEYLQTLDQDKGIWVSYDFPYAMFEPIPDGEAEPEHVAYYGEKGVKLGDYVINT